METIKFVSFRMFVVIIIKDFSMRLYILGFFLRSNVRVDSQRIAFNKINNNPMAVIMSKNN